MRVFATAAALGVALARVQNVENPGAPTTSWSPFKAFELGGNCNCDWTKTPGACNNNDGSPCWSECCDKPTPAPGPTPGCNCDWIHIPGACNTSDGSACWTVCCNGGGPTPTPPSPPAPNPPPSPIPGDSQPVTLIDEGNNQAVGNGFQRTGGMRYHSKERLNILGGSLTFTVDLSHVNDMVNANLYLVIPGTLMGGSHFYCDNSENFVNQGNACIELDIFESNGHKLAASTMHTKVGTGTGGCDTWGCRQMVNFGGTIDGNRPFDIEVRVSNDGDLTVAFHQDGKSQWAFNNAGGFDGAAKAAIVDGMRNHGAIVVSSMWTGWVPPNNAGTGDLGGSTYHLSNLAYKGVSKGPTMMEE